MTSILQKLKQFLNSHDNDQKNLKNKLDMMDAKIMHIEDIMSSYREILLRLVKQGNGITKFLSNDDPFTETKVELIDSDSNDTDIDKKVLYESIAQELKERVEKLSELEEELEKYKDQITPGQMGES